MRRIIPVMLTVVLTACGQSEAPQASNIPTVEELASDPVRLKELRQQCKTDRPNLGDVLGHAQAVLWRWHDTLYAAGKPAQDVLTA